MHEQRLTADWPVTEDGAVGGDTGNAQSRSNVVAEFVWRRHRQAFGDHGELGGGTEGPVGLRTADPHPLSDTALVDCVAHLVDDTRGARMR
jgi:hypothetical protein